MLHLIAVAAIVPMAGHASGPGACQGIPPAIVLVMTDDQGWGDIGLRDPSLSTPELDALFREGVELARFYAAAPVCSPTRASVLTGRHPARMGIDGANDGHLPRAEVTLAEEMKELEYRTGFFGKWHLGTLTREVKDSNRGGREKHAAHYSPPWEHGFDVTFATEAKVPTYDPMRSPKDGTPYGTRYWTGPGEVVEADGLTGDDSALVVDRTVAFLDAARRDGERAFAVVWLHSPHEPVVENPERTKELELDGTSARDRYVACLADVDRQVGRLKAALREYKGEHDPPVLIFCSDNGPEHKKGPGTTAGLRGRKRDLLEGGIRVPAAIWWAGEADATLYGALKRGGAYPWPATTSDLFHTVLGLTGGSDRRDGDDGFDLNSDLLFPEEWGGATYGFLHKRKRAFLSERWKIHSTDEGATWALYDIAADPGEATDLSEREPERKAELVAAFEAWHAEVRRDREDAPAASR
ncbi:MAG: sulfatase-like hydrolase/transferase [Planctomycetota bacterium]